MDKTNFNSKAYDLRTKAEKALKGSFWKNLSSSKQDRKEEAMDLYE